MARVRQPQVGAAQIRFSQQRAAQVHAANDCSIT